MSVVTVKCDDCGTIGPHDAFCSLHYEGDYCFGCWKAATLKAVNHEINVAVQAVEVAEKKESDARQRLAEIQDMKGFTW